MSGGRQPDWTLNALNKETDQKSPVGVAWSNDNGSISIRLNGWVQLTADPNLVLTLFPKRDWKSKTTDTQQTPDPNEDIPF
jgi:hypothetical protein